MTSVQMSRKVSEATSISQWIVALLFVLSPSAYGSEPLECLIEPHVLIDVSSSEIGVLASVNVDEADIVGKNEVIAALRTDVENAVSDVSRARAQAESEIELLKRDHEFTARKRERADKLNAQSVISKQDVDEVRTSQEAALLRFQAATEKQHTAQLEAIRDELALARRIVQSPIDGVVVRKYKSVGEYVDGDPILQLAQLDPLRIRVIVPMTMYGQIAVGMQATVLPELPIEGPFVASVISIDPILDAATATLGVRLSLPNPEHRLPPGLKCTLTMHPKEQPLTNSGKNADTNTATNTTLAKTLRSSASSPEIGAALKSALHGNKQSVAPSTESLDQAPISSSEPKPSAEISTLNALAKDSCVSLGPFKDISEAEAFAAVLSANDMSFARQYVPNNTDGPWTVMSRQTHVEPDALIKRLKQAGVTDVRLYKRGPWKGRMSYGFYRNNKNAQKHVSNLQALGFDAELMPQLDTNSVLRIDLGSNTSDPMHQSLIAGLREHYSNLPTRAIPCPLVESH